LAGNTPGPIIKLANSEILRGKVDAIDLNCGCPQGFALEKNYGCALLGHPDLLTDLCKQVASNISLPLSVKMRLHDDVPTTIGIMERLINVGVQAITIHGRYWWQKGEKRGLADWDSIKQIKSHFPHFPIIGNGDILSYADFDEHQRLSGVDSTMAGYGALLNPGIFSDTPIPLETMLSDYITIARQHHNKLIDVQRHIAWMMKRDSSADFKANLFKCKNIPEIQYAFIQRPPIVLKC
jgi:tRNA-dihydrouridine synthase